MISRSTAERLWNQHRQLGHVQPRQVGGHRKSRLEGHTRTLERWITRQADILIAAVGQARLMQTYSSLFANFDIAIA